jgi:hypothetical protein
MKLVRRTGVRALRFWRHLKAKRTAEAISKIGLLDCLDGYESVKAFLSDFRSREKPSFFFSHKDLQPFRGVLPRGEKKIVSDADGVCAHNFDLLGSGKTNVDGQAGKIDWHRDFKSGLRWDADILYTDTEIIKGNSSDIKVPWELSRFQHLPTLGKAYWLTEDEKYAREFVGQISDWIESNPPLYGVNWTSTMDVAIRAVNWLWGYYFFRDSPQITDEFLADFLKSLWIHGRHIRANLERNWSGVNGNHYLSDIVGLVYLGVMFPEFKEAKRWRQFGVRELTREMEKQVYPDGVDYEGSISYHRLVAELFTSATLLCLRNGISFPDWYMKRLKEMMGFVMYYAKPDGTALQVGDNDDGRLHILADYGDWKRLDHSYLLSVGAALFKRLDFKAAAGRFPEEAFWLLGEAGLKVFNGLKKPGSSLSSKAFPQGGFYVMRRDNLYMILDCVSADGRAPSGHKHNSRLSFELFAYDKSFIIDPGAYIYTADKEMRNLFRSTRSHNTVVVDGEEQNRFDEDSLFLTANDAVVKVNKWESTEAHDFWDAEHSGYERLKNPVIHQRQIYFDKREGYWVVKDTLSGEGEHQFDLFFHFAPVEVEADKTLPLVVRTKAEGANLAIIPLEAGDVSLEIVDGWVSYRYGVKVKAPVVKYSRKGQLPASFYNIVYPYEGEIDITDVIEKVKGSSALEVLPQDAGIRHLTEPG